jgi:hypothetical protein
MKKIILLALMTILLIGCQEENPNVDLLENEVQSLKMDLSLAEEKEAKMLADLDDLEKQIQALKEDASSNESIQKTVELLQGKIDTLEEKLSEEKTETLLSVSSELVHLLHEKDFESLSDYIHPSEQLTFSPYGYIFEDQDLTFTKAQVALLWDDTSVYTWGSYDGSGEPITLNFQDYYNRFVYNADYILPDQMAFNSYLGSGNTMHNIEDVYPDAMFVEYYFKGFNPEYEGMDWTSLRLVLKQIDGKWYLLHIIHVQWTI